MAAYGARVVSDPKFAQLVDALASMSANERVLPGHLYTGVDSLAANPMLLRALFVAAVGSVEPLITRYVTLLAFDALPGVYSSLADPSLERKARELCGGGPASWRTALAQTLGVATVADAVDWQRLEHLWEQRNVIVHRGGVGDARYARKTGGQIGDVPAADPEQVQAAIDEIGAIRFGLAAAVWHRIMPNVSAIISGGTLVGVRSTHLRSAILSARAARTDAPGYAQDAWAHTDSARVAAAQMGTDRNDCGLAF